MITRVNKVFIGKNIEQNTAVTEDITTIQGSMVEGEIAVLDKNYKVINNTATYAATNVIYIAEGSSEIFTTYNPDGSTLTGRRLLISGAIDGAKVKNYTGGGYSAKVEFKAALPAISDTITAGTEYVLRVVYKGDIAAQHPGQNLATYRYIAKAGDTSSDVYDGLVARVNKRYANTPKRGAQQVINAVNNVGTLELTALPVASCTTSINDIDELVMNSFEVFLNYVDSDYNWTEVGLSNVITYTDNDRGFGTWETIRDAEKHAQSYEGISNRTHFPIITPAMRVIKDGEYDMIVIEHERVYQSPDNQYRKETPLTEVVALEGSIGSPITPQSGVILGILNAWMASTPGSFSAVSFA
jgi:hypothetical protein